MTYYQIETRQSPDHRWQVREVWRMDQYHFPRFFKFFQFYEGIHSPAAADCYRIRRTVGTTAQYEFDGTDLVKLSW